MKFLVEQEGLSSKISCDSAGTIGFHAGSPADARMQSHAIRRTYDLTSKSRRFNPEIDFDKFDLVIGMDDQNIHDLQIMDSYRKYQDNVFSMTEFCTTHQESEVPDPYYGGDAGFELVLDIIEDGCRGLLEKIRKEL